MKRNNLIMGGLTVLFLLLSVCQVFSQEEENIITTPRQISLDKLAGELVDETIWIENAGPTDIFLKVSGLRGDIIQALPAINKPWLQLSPNETSSLQLRGYVKKDATPGTYLGELLLESEQEEYRLPVTLQIIKPGERIVLSLDISPLKSEIGPGEVLRVRYVLRNTGAKEVQGELGISLVDGDTVIIKELVTFTVLTSVEGIVELKTAKDLQEKNYDILATAAVVEKGLKKEKATNSATIIVKKRISGLFDSFSREITPAVMLFLFLLILVLILLLTAYRYYNQEKWGKKRYMASLVKSISFPGLPKKGPRSGFVGSVAGTTYQAFIDLDQLNNHVLVAGATGTGKTVAAQIIAEEALLKGAAVVVFDPTAQWTGFLRENRDNGQFRLYGKFGMKRKDAQSFNGNIYVINDPEEEMPDLNKCLRPGEISIFCLHKLDSRQIEPFIASTIQEVIYHKLEESSELRALFIYEEIHRILPKFGGIGKGLTWLEKGVREFRKWGIGLVLISQVLSDFHGEIKANIGTEIQLMTRYEDDLKRIKLKYGKDAYRCIVKARIGEGLLQNAEYNKGRPYFVKFRPSLHNLRRLTNDELDTYCTYNQKIDELKNNLDKIKDVGRDIFDLEIELDLAFDALKKGRFNVVDLYLEGLTPRITELWQKVEKGEIKESDKYVSSEWDHQKETELEAYKRELQGTIEREREILEAQEEKLKEKRDAKLMKEEAERAKLEHEELQLSQELEEKRTLLNKKNQVLDLLDKYKKVREILNEEVASKEWEKLDNQKKKLKELEEPRLEQIKEEKERKEQEIEAIMTEMKVEEERISQGLDRIEEMWIKIKGDEQKIIEQDREICQKEWELIERIKDEIKKEIEQRGKLKEELTKEREKWDQDKLREELAKRAEHFERSRRTKAGTEMEQRKSIERDKKKLHEKLKSVKQKWLDTLSKEGELKKKEDEIFRLEKELEKTEGMISDVDFERFKEIATELSGELDEENIEEFEQDPDFGFYQEILSQKDTSDEEKRRFIAIVDNLLGKLTSEKIENFVEDKKNYSLYQRLVRWGER